MQIDEFMKLNPKPEKKIRPTQQQPKEFSLFVVILLPFFAFYWNKYCLNNQCFDRIEQILNREG